MRGLPKRKLPQRDQSLFAKEVLPRLKEYRPMANIASPNPCPEGALVGKLMRRQRMKFRSHEAVIKEGEFVVVPRGVEHCPVADEEVHIILIEPKSTLNTGNITNERTVAQLERN